jgi:ATP-dependent Lhr-like helicase
VRVEDAHGAAPNIPFWLGEAPGRSDELSFGVARLREEVVRGWRRRASRRRPRGSPRAFRCPPTRRARSSSTWRAR